MERRRVVITGLGAVTPIGLTAGESWSRREKWRVRHRPHHPL